MFLKDGSSRPQRAFRLESPPADPPRPAISLAMTNTDRPNLLYIAHRIPQPLDKGERIRVYHTLEFLAARANVHLACLADEPVAIGSVERLRSICERVEVVPLRWTRWCRAALSLATGRSVTEGAFASPRLADLIRAWARDTQYHAAMASSSGMAPYLRLGEVSRVPAVIDLIDVDSQKWFDYAETTRGPRAWLYGTEGRRVRQLELSLPSNVHAVTLVSDAETRLFRSFSTAKSVTVPIGVNLEYFQPAYVDQQPLSVFVGALDYRPNVDGLLWFCHAVWPEVMKSRPDARFSIVGRNPTSAIRRLGRVPGVEVAGPVRDVRPFLARASIVVAPLRLARGVQNKVIEALAMGKAVVASPAAVAGLSARAGEHLLVAASESDWREAITRLLNDERRRRQLGASGRRHVETLHTWDRCLSPLVELLGLTDVPVRPRRAAAGEQAA